MIYSAANILELLGGDAVIRQEARLTIVDGSPGLGFEEYVYIYIDKYPTIDEFEATWKIWVVNGGSDLLDLVLQGMAQLLPSFDRAGSYYTTTDFASERTVVKSEAEKELEATRAEREQLKGEFSVLSVGVQDQLARVRSGVDGLDGLDGRDGRDGAAGKDGRDGQDMVATDASLFDLNDVVKGLELKRGQVLTWNGIEWTNLYIPQILHVGGGGGSGGGGDSTDENVIISTTAPTTRDDGKPLQDGDQWWNNLTGLLFIYYIDDDTSQWVQSAGSGGPQGGIEEAPTDGQDYVRNNATWQPRTTIPEAPVDGTIYARQNSTWVPVTTVPPDLSNASINDIGDVLISGEEVGEGLIWDGTNWVNGGDFSGGAF